jgi:hypothetical protein
MRSKALAQALSFAHNKVHFSTLYPLSNAPLPAGGGGTVFKAETFFYPSVKM